MKKSLILLLMIIALMSFCACDKTPAEEENADGETAAVTEEEQSDAVKPEIKEDEAAAEDEAQDTEAEANEQEEPAAPEDTAAAAPEEQTASPTPSETPAPAPAPYSEQTADTVLTVCGSALDRNWYFSLSDLQNMGGYYSAYYFSRGKEPQEETNSFSGILVSYLLDSVIGASYSKATFTASDGYAGSHSYSAIHAYYVNEQDPSASLPMILAWTQDGSPCGLRLVMGQQIAGEYNRTYWVRDVITIELQ
ncbi:MAG: hypothetical protein IJH56_01365 [Firmicutes bacterium]|nr:hypothetical protein [Bacillota bacterium]MBR0179998.1 hypothetical protein [Bacillota bacterium]